MVYRSDCSEGGEKPHNAFRNDGSFLEMFKKLQGKAATTGDSPPADEAASTATEGSRSEDRPTTEKQAPGPSKSLPLVGKRRGGRVLPTGKVKKLKTESSAKEASPTDAWSLYLAEVKRYKETTCEEDGKTRPLVK